MELRSEADILTYLHFGYLPHYDDKTLNSFCEVFSNKNHLRVRGQRSPESLILEGARILKYAFESGMRGHIGMQILPLSGGLDSRAILGGLLENMETRQIQTVTFGTPGTWDFEIGQQVAHAAGVACEKIDLSARNWTWHTEDLVSTAAQTAAPVWVFDAHVNRTIAKYFGEEPTYWSGYMGDPLSGSHLFNEDSKTWEQAKWRFLTRNLYSISVAITNPEFKSENCLPSEPFLDLGLVSYDEQLDFSFRQACLIRHIVMPRGYDYRAPLLHPDWISFILSVPRSYRTKQWLYEEVLKTAYPELLSLPTKKSYGLSLTAPRFSILARRTILKANSLGRYFLPALPWAVDPRLNYIDFDRHLRESSNFQTLVKENLHDLKKRDVVGWIDLDAIWRRHQLSQANHADALLLLVSLEINLKAKQL